MNELSAKFASSLQVLAFPCNQFGHQENTNESEILLSLKHVRPGNGYEPKFPVFSKVNVNGKDAHPLFHFLRESHPFPEDMPYHLMGNAKFIMWEPVCRNDISWNFEKFLVGPDGVPFKRYSPKYPTRNIQEDIEVLIKKFALS